MEPTMGGSSAAAATDPIPLLEIRGISKAFGHVPVSYTHLTLPTICSV